MIRRIVSMLKPIFCLMGPTASGKTALGTELIKHFPFELISVDSAMIYRGMDIGTAKPSKEEQRLTPHRLIDICDPIDAYSAAEFCVDAKTLCQDIIQRGKLPLLIGGTMMYFQALQKGLASLPEADPEIRARLDAVLTRDGVNALHQRLSQVDPQTASVLHPHDRQRIQRALEIFELTGTPLSQLLAAQRNQHAAEYHYINIGLFPVDRAKLHQQIESRFTEMLSQGLVEEVRALQDKWTLDERLPSMRSVGYRQVLGYLKGQYDVVCMTEKAIAATRQLAKRQFTWLRHWPEIRCYDSQSHGTTKTILEKIEQLLNDGTGNNFGL